MPPRLPGEPVRRARLYTCPVCGFTTWATSTPECPNGHGRMSDGDEQTFKDRREAIRRAREESEKAKEKGDE
jgi:hypothetical protein